MTGRPAAILIPDLLDAELQPAQPVIYDTPVGLRQLHIDPHSGDEHYLVHYPQGMTAAWHHHSAAAHDHRAGRRPQRQRPPPRTRLVLSLPRRDAHAPPARPTVATAGSSLSSTDRSTCSPKRKRIQARHGVAPAGTPGPRPGLIISLALAVGSHAPLLGRHSRPGKRTGRPLACAGCVPVSSAAAPERPWRRSAISSRSAGPVGRLRGHGVRQGRGRAVGRGGGDRLRRVPDLLEPALGRDQQGRQQRAEREQRGRDRERQV